ncbi:MAG: hypothetical protein Q4A81_05270 [Pasteurellaceae bacterium]|nr:hypothetical protein [Pasteurellaceae bacterium]
METMTHSPLNVDLKKMDYETFKTFMRELAQMYSDVKDDAYLLFFRNLEQLAKVVSTLPRNPLVFYGAYEIADNQVVVAIFEIQFTDEVYETENGRPYQMLNIISSFAEDKTYLHCPTKIREHLTQPEYVALCEQAYPAIMEQMLLEEQCEKLFRRKQKGKQ